MEIIQKDIVLLLKSAITGKKYELSKQFNINNIMTIAHNHSIVSLIFHGAMNCGMKLDNPIMQKLFAEYCSYLGQHEKQMYEINRIYEEFEKTGINYMPVKGCNMKSLYPQPEMRVMGDADILIKRSQYNLIQQIMEKLGFEFELEGDHDYTWISPNLHLELHYLLMYSYNEEYERYFGNGWKLAKYNEGHKFGMSPEDEFIYMFIHFTKHYRSGGIGCRHVVDLWVYLRSYPNLNFKYIEEVMERLSVSKFFKNMINMIDMWFNDMDGDDVTELMTQYIFDSGSWGTLESASMARGVRAIQTEGNEFKGRIKVVREAIFPSLNIIRHRYNILRKYPCLLPAVWVWRWIDAVLFRKANVMSYKKEVENILQKDMSIYEKNLQKVGLNFTFDEQKMNNAEVKYGKK